MEARADRITSLGIPPELWTSVVDPSAVMGDSVLAGHGVWIQSGAAIMPTACIGSHVAVRSNAHVSHDVVVGDFVSVGIGAIVCGYSRLMEGAYLAPGTIIRDGVTVGKYSVIGLGATVVSDIPDYAIAMGNPARVVRMTSEVR
jgi:acetyltransferase EpsM